MYDGIKIECSAVDRSKWEKSLAMIGRYAETSGEVLPLAAEATVHSCTFSRVPGLLYPHYTFQGSLHKFFRNGGENDDDFTLSEVRQSIEILENKYGFKKNNSKVINFEFGVNVNLPPGMLASDFNKYLVSAYTKSFEKINPKRPAVGYIAEFHDFSIKVYDKGYLAANGSNDQVRVEIKVNRTRWLDQFGFKKGKDLYLSDLLKEENIKILGDILIQKIRSLILTPREIEIKKLSHKQRLTFYECRDARCWEEWTSKQRERKRQQLNRIFEKLNQQNPVDVLAELVAAKWKELTTEQVQKEIPIAPKRREKVNISTLIVAGIRDLLRYFLNSHETKQQSFFFVYSPRGKPLPRPPDHSTIEGYTRWTDLNIRPPPDDK